MADTLLLPTLIFPLQLAIIELLVFLKIHIKAAWEGLYSSIQKSARLHSARFLTAYALNLV